MGHASSAIERRAQRARPEGQEHKPVTVRGQFNELVRESRKLGLYIERGREWLRSVGERVKALGSGLGMSDLVQGAAQTMRAELDKAGGAGIKPKIEAGRDRGQELPPFDRGRDYRGRGGPSR